jgi:pimeloyl-ACP methyl ester carboxylesterase
MAEPILKRANGDQIEIQLAQWKGQGRQILCIHGLTANCRCWDRAVEGLTPEYPVMAMDLRGRGLSDKPPAGYSIEHHVSDVYSVVEDEGLGGIFLMGHSLGAYVSLAFAARYPGRVRRLILLDGAGHLSQAQWDQIEAVIKPALDRLGQVFATFEEYVAPMKQVPFLQPWNRFLDIYFHYDVEAVQGGVRSRTRADHIEEEIENIRSFDAAQFYPGISCPVLILRATEGILSQADLVLPEGAAERMTREIPNARRVDIEGANHYSILFQPSEVRDKAIRDFLVH